MPHIEKHEYETLATEGYNRIPIMHEVFADMDTPLSTYRKLCQGPYSYLFESVQGGEKWGRYSIIGLPAKTIIKVFDKQFQLFVDDKLVEEKECADPLQAIEEYHEQFKVPRMPELPLFNGGLVGYFGYDCVRYIEPKLDKSKKDDPLGNPDILLMLSDEVVVFDNLRGKLYIVVHALPDEANAYDNAEARLLEIEEQLFNTVVKEVEHESQEINESDFVSGFTESKFKDAVEKIKEYVVEGDTMQTVLSQRLSIPFNAPSINLYRALRCLNPSPYMYYIDLDDFQIVGSSPEILVRLEENEVTVRPIAGTRKRGKNQQDDLALEEELLNDPKELAEHLMLIDLGRNDIGRIAKTGTVTLTDKMVIERYSHVMHIVSNVTGELKDDMNAMDVLRATFPAGTVSGAPKIRAMEIIDELEPVKRGVYAGAVGYLSWAGNMDTAIAIRTAVIKDKTLHIQAGAGVVADSIPDLEWKETMNKGRAIFSAVALAEKGLK